MDSDAVPSTLDEIILALRPGAGEASAPMVFELAAGDLISDGAGELVDLTNILAAGQGQDGALATAHIALFSVVGRELVAVQPADAAGLANHAGDGSILYAAEIFDLDNPASS